MPDPGIAMQEFYPGRDKVQATSAFLHTMHWSLEILLVRASCRDKRFTARSVTADAAAST